MDFCRFLSTDPGQNTGANCMPMRHLRSIVVFLVLSTAIFHSACTKKSAPGGDPNASEILFGEYGSMTGPESTFGVSTHNGLMMAIDKVNATGGINGKKIRVISYDDQGKSDEAVTAITKLITQDKVHMVIGEVASSRSIAAGAVAQQYKVPMISPASTNPRVTEIGNYIFRVCFIDPFQGAVMARFARNNLKKTKAAIFKDMRSDYSVGLAKFFSEEWARLGGTIVAEDSYSSGDVDFKPQLDKIKSHAPEVVFVPGYYTEVGLIARQARERNLNSTLLGGDGWDSDKLTQIAGPGIYGSYISNHYSADDKSPAIQEFVAQYKAKYKETPNSLAAQGYDAALIAMDSVKRSPDLSAKALRDSIAATKNFPAVTGVITLNEKRDAVKPAVVLKVVGPQKFEFITTINP